MTIEEAIRILDPDTTAEALVEYEYYGGFNGKAAMVNAVSDACEVAVEALREQQAPSKLDRCRWEGCEYCLEDKGIVTFEVPDEIEIPEEDVKMGWVEKPQYCPICGRPLTEEAWAEMEGRINDGAADIS